MGGRSGGQSAVSEPAMRGKLGNPRRRERSATPSPVMKGGLCAVNQRTHLREAGQRDRLGGAPEGPALSHNRIVTCVRCRRPGQKVAKVMTDGPLCGGCRGDAFRRRGRCSSCGVTRLLPGADATGALLCLDCAGEAGRSYVCRRCGTEWELVRGLCEWCHIGDVLDELFEGDVDLSALRARLVAVARPDHILQWLHGPDQKRLLSHLATGTVSLTHEGLDGFKPRRVAEHVRGLLVVSGLLPSRDEHLARFDRYVKEQLASLAQTSEHEKILTLYVRWQLRPKLVGQSEQKPLSKGRSSPPRATWVSLLGSLPSWANVATS